jgi:phosphohistidine phosphatase
MKELYIVRHAKSSWDNPNLQDIDRPLKGRGVNDAYNTADWMMSQDFIPDVLISSPATRALHTAMILARTFHIDFSNIQVSPNLYDTWVEDYVEVVKNISDEFDRAAIFGHNPTITSFINYFADVKVSHVPTTGVACLRFACDSWKDVSPPGKLLFFDYPKKRK